MKVAFMLLGGLVLVVLSLVVFEGHEYLQVALLSSGTTMAGCGILMDEEEDRRDHH